MVLVHLFIVSVCVCVQMIEKCNSLSRSKVFKEIEIFHICQGNENILNLVEYFEEEDRFYLVFDKMLGGTLLANIESRGHLTEREASLVIRDIAKALDFLHSKGRSTVFKAHLTVYPLSDYLLLFAVQFCLITCYWGGCDYIGRAGGGSWKHTNLSRICLNHSTFCHPSLYWIYLASYPSSLFWIVCKLKLFQIDLVT